MWWETGLPWNATELSQVQPRTDGTAAHRCPEDGDSSGLHPVKMRFAVNPVKPLASVDRYGSISVGKYANIVVDENTLETKRLFSTGRALGYTERIFIP